MYVVNKKCKMESGTVSGLNHNHILSAYLAFVARSMEPGRSLLHARQDEKLLGQLL